MELFYGVLGWGGDLQNHDIAMSAREAWKQLALENWAVNLEQGSGATPEAGFVQKLEVKTRQYIKAKNSVRDLQE